MAFHTFGDSHSEYGWKKIEGVRTHRVGPCLCFSFGKEKLGRLNISDPKFSVSEGDTVCFCFGEIDCRSHVHKHISQEKTYQSVIDSLIENYIEAIKANVTLFSALKTCVSGIVPAARITSSTGDYPFLGTSSERLNYVLYFNEALKSACEKNSYTFVDVYTKYADDEGLLNKKLTDDGIHIDNESFLLETLKELNLL